MIETKKQKYNMQQLIGNALRIGVTSACLLALISGTYYLIKHGSEPMPDYTTFKNEPKSLTTLNGIFNGIFKFEAKNWIQLGVLVLMFTPVLRIILSIFDYIQERDWLYVIITSIVFLVILSNSLGGA